MVYFFLAASIGLFILGINVLGVVPRVKHVIANSREALSVVQSTQMSEDDKEAAIQKAAVRMFGAFGSILVRVAVICLVPVGFVYLCAGLGFYTTAEALQASTDVYFIIISSIVMIAALFFIK